MIRTEPIIGVSDVAHSSAWYQTLLGCESRHGGPVFEILADADGTTVLCLHKWGEHEHPTLRTPEIQPGNGLILYIRVDDLPAAWQNAGKLGATIEAPPHLSPNSGLEEFSLRDPDGYFITVSL